MKRKSRARERKGGPGWELRKVRTRESGEVEAEREGVEWVRKRRGERRGWGEELKENEEAEAV